MSKFPVELDDDEGQADAINYLLSGPSGLGQNFAGFSSYIPGYLTGNFRIPYSQPTSAELYVAPIDIATTEMLDARTIKLTFSGYVGTTPPFALGNGLSVDSLGLDYDDYISDYGTQIGVVECTTAYVIIRLRKNLPQLDPSTGGTVQYYSTGGFDNSTDCNARVIINGVTDRVFITAQLDNLISYTVLGTTGNFSYRVRVNRYKGVVNNDPVNPDFTFDPDTTVAEKTYTYDDLTGTGTLPLVETVFATIIDQPPIGYYWYILEVSFDWDGDFDEIQATESLMQLRCLSAQVVKE